MVSASAGPVRLAEVDHAWLRMDDPTNLMVVTGVMVLDEPVTLDEIRDIVVRRLLRFPRFRQRVVEDASLGTAYWEEDPRLALDYHLVEATLPEHATEAALQAFVSELMSQPLDRKRPLWQLHVVPRYQGGSALVTRVHHCIGDGLALTYVMLSMADDGPAAPPDTPGSATPWLDPWNAAARSLAQAIGAAMHVPAHLVAEINRCLERPERLAETAGQVASGLLAVQKLLTMPPDPPTPFKGPLVHAKRVAWSQAIPIEVLRRTGKAMGATINDVLVSSLAGALRAYLGPPRGTVPDQLDVRGVVPVNLRPLDEAHQLGNRFGLVFLALPLGIEDPLERLFEVRRRMRAIKHSPEAQITLHILRGLGLTPRPVFDRIVELFGSKATAVVTNVVGPREPMRFAGRPMRQAMFWVPCSGRLGLGVSLLSYAGQVWVGVQTDAGLVPDPGALVEAFVRELGRLAELEALTRA